MKKNILLLALLQCSLLISCNNANNSDSIKEPSNSIVSEEQNSESAISNEESEEASNKESASSEESEESASSEEVSESEENNQNEYEAYGEFAITSEDGEFTYNEETNTYLLTTANATYSLTGYLENGRIEVSAEASKVTVELNSAAIVSSLGSAIYYTADSKSLEVKSMERTTNYLISGESDDILKATIQSENNVKLTGQGELYITSQGNAISGSDVSIKSSIVTITAEKNAIKAKQFAMVYNTDEEGKVFGTPTLNVLKATSAIKCELTSKGKKGSAYIFGGIIDCTDVSTVFAIDADLYLSYESTWDSIDYAGQDLFIAYNESSTLYEVAGEKYISEDNITFDVK